MKTAMKLQGFTPLVQRQKGSASFSTFPIWFLALVVLALFTSSCTYSVVNDINTDNTTDTTVVVQDDNDGNLVVVMRPVGNSLSSYDQIRFDVDSVRVRSTSGNWVDVSSTVHAVTFADLSDGDYSLVVQGELPVGTYDRIALDISEVVLIRSNNGREYMAAVPNRVLEVGANIVVTEENAAVVMLDFLVDRSVQLVTVTDEYIIRPVVVIETKTDAVVDVREPTSVVITGGSTTTNTQTTTQTTPTTNTTTSTQNNSTGNTTTGTTNTTQNRTTTSSTTTTTNTTVVVS
jgi:hypothetical protein